MKDNYNENLNERFDNKNNEDNENNINKEMYFRKGKPILIKELIWEIIQDIEHEMEIESKKASKKASQQLIKHFETDFFKSLSDHISKLNDT
jgi:hypothetical protein